MVHTTRPDQCSTFVDQPSRRRPKELLNDFTQSYHHVRGVNEKVAWSFQEVRDANNIQWYTATVRVEGFRPSAGEWCRNKRDAEDAAAGKLLSQLEVAQAAKRRKIM